MKAYKDYMDKISVSEELHKKLISFTSKTKPIHSSAKFRRYVTVFACFVVILLTTIILKNNVTPGTNLTIPQLDNTNGKDEYSLILNKANYQTANDIYIPKHFWLDVSVDELHTLFPALIDQYSVTATANFQGNGTLFNIDARAITSSGSTAYIQVAPGEVILDYVIDGKEKKSDILGVPVTAAYFKVQSSTVYFASFKLRNVGYYVELSGGKVEEADLAAILQLIISGGAADLSIFNDPVIPELREDYLTINEAQKDSDFGVYLPKNLPSGFSFESALRFINQEQDYLSASWVNGMHYINWHITKICNDDRKRITSVSDIKNYDVSIYPIPTADSVPKKLQGIVDNPIFHINDLTLDVVKARAYKVTDEGDESGPRMRFSVLYGDTLVELNAKGVSPETIFKMIQQIKSQS